MNHDKASVAKAYYKAMGEKNVEEAGKHLHPEVQFIAPLGKKSGKEAVLEAAKAFMNLYNSLKVRSAIGSEDQAMVVYDLACPEPLGSFSTAVSMDFKEGLISKIELFFDARPFQTKG